METTYKLENQKRPALQVEEPQGSYQDCPSPKKKYPNYLCNRIES